ncbi:permease [Heyndrickxia sp. NPDC080065]|uniref:permease n=1 Tax=Heyndrickxia sp. NPDC080065 TaxID=3390568 RepID=UPI003D00C76C
MIFSKIRGMKETFVVLLFLIFIYLFLFSENIKDLFTKYIPNDFFNVNTIFLSIVLEAIPFILIGVFASALIQSFVSEKTIQKILPRHAFLAMIPASLLGVIFPICECAIIPIARRLIKKGLPQHVGIVFMLTVPILNPVVFLSTYYAFQNDHVILYVRMGLAFVVAIIVGSMIYLLFHNKNILKHALPFEQNHFSTVRKNRLGEVFKHASDEFFDTGKFLIIGALCASFFQTFLDRSLLVSIGTNETAAPAVMMGFSYVLSLCSEADAFVASSFHNTFTMGSLIAFLVMGPMLDIKNTIMLFAYFRMKFVISLMVITIVTIYGLSRLVDILL